MYLYGGAAFDDSTQSLQIDGDLWTLDHANGLGGTPTWTQIATAGTSPGPLYLHTAVLDQANERMIVLGGRDQSQTARNSVFVLVLGTA